MRTTSLDVNLLLVWGYISVGSLWGESWVTCGECGVHLSSLQSVSREKDRPERVRCSCLPHPAVSDELPHGAALRSRGVGKTPSSRAPQWGSLLLPNDFFSRWRLNSPPGNWASEAPFLPPRASHGGATVTASGPPICAPTCVPLVSIPTTPYTLDTQIHLCGGTAPAVKFWVICFTSLSLCPASTKGGARTSTREARQVGVRPGAGSQLPLQLPLPCPIHRRKHFLPPVRVGGQALLVGVQPLNFPTPHLWATPALCPLRPESQESENWVCARCGWGLMSKCGKKEGRRERRRKGGRE